MDIGNIQLTDKEIQAGNINIPVIKGAPGKDGYTPVKGKDYWTTQDKEEIVQEINQDVNDKLEAKANKEEVEAQLETKVDKEEGKGLSEENFTIKDKEKLESIVPESQAKLQGTSFHIPDSAEAPMKISPRGNDIEQETREGYNKFNKNRIVSGSFVSSAIVTNADWCYDVLEGFEVGETYTTSGGRSIISFFNGDTNLSYVDILNTQFTIPENTTKVYMSTLISNKDVFQVVKGTEEKEYEQYGAMPSLAFPSPVKHVGGSVKSYNKFNINTAQYGTLSQTDGTTINQNTEVMVSDYIEVNQNTIYTFSNSVKDLAVRLFLYGKNKEFISTTVVSTSSQTKTTYATDNSTYYIRVQLSKTFAQSNFMIYKGTEEKPYLPYGEVGSVYDIAKVNKNLFDKNVRDIAGYFYNVNGNVQNSDNWYIVNVKAKPNTNYYLSGNNINNTTAHMVLLDKNKTCIKVIGTYTDTHSIATTNDTEYIGLSVPIYSDSTDVDTIMLEEGSTATDYIVHQQENRSLDLTNLPLYSKNDYIYKSGDKWFVHNEYGKELLSGKLNGLAATSDSSKFMVGFNLDNALRHSSSTELYAGYSNLLKGTNRQNLYENLVPGIAYASVASTYYGTGGVFYFEETAKMTLPEINDFITEKGMYVVYPLATPTETEITDKKVIAVLEELYNTYAYDEVTNISVDNPILSAPLVLDVEYYIKTALGLETKVSYEEYAKLLKRVEELENVILTLGGTI